MSSNKTFKNLDEQVEILRNKGLTIDDVNYTKEILLRENYFFLSGYRHIFMNDNKESKFVEGTNFKELYAMFLFDRALRNIFFKWILVVENNFKSITSYALSKKYGFKDKEYLNPKNFNPDSMKQRQVHDVLNKVKRQIRVNGQRHSATMHYIDNYGYIPMWILVKVLSFGIMSEFYGILKSDDQLAIANNYRVDVNTLCIYLSIVANYRNICAHEEILYDHKTQKSIPDNSYFNMLNIPKNEEGYIYGKNDLYSLVLIMKKLLTRHDFKDLIGEISYEVDKLSGRITSIPTSKVLNSCGFPENWLDITNYD